MNKTLTAPPLLAGLFLIKSENIHTGNNALHRTVTDHFDETSDGNCEEEKGDDFDEDKCQNILKVIGLRERIAEK